MPLNRHLLQKTNLFNNVRLTLCIIPKYRVNYSGRGIWHLSVEKHGSKCYLFDEMPATLLQLLRHVIIIDVSILDDALWGHYN